MARQSSGTVQMRQVDHVFPPTTSVAAYPREAKQPGRAPTGASLASASVGTDTLSTLSFTGLPDDRRLTAYALAGGAHRYLDFSSFSRHV